MKITKTDELMNAYTIMSEQLEQLKKEHEDLGTKLEQYNNTDMYNDWLYIIKRRSDCIKEALCIGVYTDGIDFIPDEGTWNLHMGRRITHNESKLLKEYLERQELIKATRKANRKRK